MDKKRSMSELKRQAILDAAKQAFVEHGFAATSMDTVAKTADVSKRTVYNHFPSKEDLFSAIVKELISLFAEEEGAAYRSDEGLKSQLLAIAHGRLDLLVNDELLKMSRLVLSETIRAPEKMSALMGSATKKEVAFEQWLKNAVADGELVIDDISFAANQFSSLLKGAAFWPQVVMGQSRPNKKTCNLVAERSVTMFLATYAA